MALTAPAFGQSESSDLHREARLGNTEAVGLLLGSGADPAARDREGRTPLHLAANEAVAKALLEAGADPSARDHSFETPLHRAATEAVVAALIAAGADPVATDWLERTPLHYAASEAVARALLLAGADPNATTRVNWWTPLHQAASEGVAAALIEAGADPSIGYPLHDARSGGAVKVFVAAGLDPDALDADGYTPLHSVQTGEAAQALLDAGADPLYRRFSYWDFDAQADFHNAVHGDFSNYQARYDSRGSQVLPLHSAIQSGRTEVVRVLLEAEAYDPDNRMHVHDPRTGFTAQYLAGRYNHAAILHLLIDAGFDPDARNFPDRQATQTERFQQLPNRILPDSQFNKVGEAPLHVAAQRGYTNSIRVLLAAGATVEAEDWDDSTPLSLARVEEVKALLEGNKDVGDLHLTSDAGAVSRDWQGRTPLHRAATEAEAKALLEAGADPHARDNDSQTPLHHAATEGVAAALIAAGADPVATDRFGQTPLHTAANEGVVSALLAAGADPNALYGGRTPLYRAATEGVAAALIAAGADPNTETTRNTLLLNARSGGAVKVLVEAGLDPNAETTSGYTPLHYVQTGEAAQALLDAGADPLRRRVYTARSSSDVPFTEFLRALSGDLTLWGGGSAFGGAQVLPLHRAIESFQGRRPDVVRVLLEAGAYDPSNKEHVYDPRAGFTALYLGAANNSAEILQLLIDAGFDPDARNLPDRQAMETQRFQQLIQGILPESQFNKVGKSALHRAAERGGANSVRVLLAAGATVDAEDWDGTTPLQVASTGAVMELLVDGGADPNVTNTNGETPLHYAPTKGVVKRLLDRGADPNVADDSGNTPLHSARTAAVVQQLLEADADPNAVNSNGRTPLMNHAGTPEAVKFLLDAGANSSAVAASEFDPGMTWTPLLIAVRANAADSVRLLLADGAPVDTKYENGSTLLHYAATAEIVRLLLDAGLDPNATDDWGNTPLHSAVKVIDDPEETMVALLEGEADPDATDGSGLTPLWFAAATGKPGVLRTLLAHGASVDAKEHASGTTPLFQVVNYGAGYQDLDVALEMTEILLEAGADPNAETNDGGETPLTHAERWGNNDSEWEPLLKLLRDAAAEREPEPAFEPQRIPILLGLSGDTVVLMTTESGGFTLEGRMFESGGTVTAGNGNQYTLMMDANGSWTAEYVGVTVMLGTSGLRLHLRRMEDGSWRAGERPIKSGDTILGYTLTMNADGTWTAVGP